MASPRKVPSQLTFKFPESFGYPKIAEIIKYMDSNKTKYAVIDYHTENSFFSRNKNFEEYFYSHYSLEKEIDNIKIYKRVQ